MRIGAIFNLSPSGEPVGRWQWEGARLAVEEANARGGLRLAEGARRAVELLVYDDAGRPERTRSTVRRLVEGDNVVALLGTSDPGSAAAAAESAEQRAVPLIALASPARDRPAASDRWTFWLVLNPNDMLTVMVETISGSRVERVGWIAPRTMSAESARSHLVREATQRALRIVAEESYSLVELDLSERVARLVTAGAEVIVGWPRAADDAAVIAKAMHRAPRARLYLGPPAATDRFLTLAGETARGVRTPTVRLQIAGDLWDHDPLTPVIREFARTYEVAYGYAPSTDAATAWDAARLLIAAIERDGANRAAIGRSLERITDFPGASGPIDFSADDHEGLDRRAPLVARVVAGGWRIPP